MNRYLIISDEPRKIGPKECIFVHFDIIVAPNIDDAYSQLRRRRLDISHTVHLSLKEVEKIYIAMLEKSDEAIQAKFLENTK